MRDVKEFQERFNRYKNGESVSDIYNLPKFKYGTEPNIDSTINFLKQHEGFRDTAYIDGNGVPTIGYGFTDSALVKKGKISRAEADARLKREVLNREAFLSKLANWDKLNEGSKTALRSYYYNYPAGFKDTTRFMKAWNSGNYKEAIKQVDAGWNDTKNPGLRKRRQQEQALLMADPFLIHKPVVLSTDPIVEQPVSTAVRQVIPEQLARYTWTGSENISPYVTGRPVLKLKPAIKLPNLIDLVEDSEWEPTLGFKNGKLPRYRGGLIPYTSSDGTLYNINPNVVESELLNVTTPEIFVTGKDRHPLYQRYDAEHSTYDPNAIRSITDWAPIVGDVGQGLDAYNAFKNQDYLQAGLLGGMLLLPTVIENGGRMLYRGLRKIGAPRWFVHDIVSDPKRVFKDWYSGDYAFTNKGRSSMLLRDNLRLNALAEDIKQNVISDELLQRKKRVEFAKQKGILTDIMTDIPKDKDITYTYNTQFDPNKILGLSTNPIEIAYYEHPVSSRFKYKWDGYDGHELPITVGHEFVHRLENDYMFSPHFKTSSSVPGKTGYNVPAEGFELITNGAFHMPSARSLMDISEVRSAFSPIISRYNSNLNRIAEANKLGSKEIDFSTHPWHSSPAEVVADLRGAIAAGMNEESIYKFMYDKYLYDGDKVRELRNIGFKDGKSPIRIKPENRGKLTRLKKRTGKSESELYNDGNPAHKKMVVFARNARKWSHK